MLSSLTIAKKCIVFKLTLFFVIAFVSIKSCHCETHYNIIDPDCSGPFGTCTQADKTRLGYASIKKLHEKMDEDKDGELEVHETKEFIKDDLAFKNGGMSSSDRQKKLHSKDNLITVDELWKTWEYSQEYNWTTNEVVQWLEEVVKLPEYSENFRRNLIDGQFLPRLVSNENHYYSNVMQIKDSRHKRLLMIKATDLVLFGAQQRPHNIVKDIIMIGALTLSIFVCIYLYSKHRKSLEQIQTMLIEFDKLTSNEESAKMSSTPLNGIGDYDLFSAFKKRNSSLNLEGTMIDKTDLLKKMRENSQEEAETKSVQNQEDDTSVYQLKLAEQELQRVKAALKRSESQLDSVKYLPPPTLISLLNKTYESEKSLLEYKLSVIDKDKTECVDALNKVCKRQAGFLGALKIAHSSTLEDIQHKLEGLKLKHQKLKAEQHESTKRWNNIFELCVRNDISTNALHSTTPDTLSNQDMLKAKQEGLINSDVNLPRKNWHPLSTQNINKFNNNNNAKSSLNDLMTDSFYSAALQIFQQNLALSLYYPSSNSAVATAINNSSNLLDQSNFLQYSPKKTSLRDNNSLVSSVYSAYNNNAGSNSVQDLRDKINQQNEENYLRQNQVKALKSTTVTSMSSSDITKPILFGTELFDSKYTVEDRVANPNMLSNSRVEFILEADEHVEEKNNNTVVQTNYNNKNSPTERKNKLVIISPVAANNALSQPNSQVYNEQTAVQQQVKISRDTLIHTNDMFQFDDVDSVQTADMLIKKTPQSSFESEDTYKSNSIFPSLIKSKNSKDKKSFLRSSFNKISKNSKENDKKDIAESLKSLEHSKSFSRTLSSLRSKIFSSKQSLFNSQNLKQSQTIDTIASKNPPEITITSSVSSMVQLGSQGNKQLTIQNLSVCDNLIKQQRSQSNSSANLNVSMPHTPNSNTSFTIKSSNTNTTESPSSASLSPVKIDQSPSEKSQSKIFNFKGKAKKKKSPKKKK